MTRDEKVYTTSLASPVTTCRMIPTHVLQHDIMTYFAQVGGIMRWRIEIFSSYDLNIRVRGPKRHGVMDPQGPGLLL